MLTEPTRAKCPILSGSQPVGHDLRAAAQLAGERQRPQASSTDMSSCEEFGFGSSVAGARRVPWRLLFAIRFGGPIAANSQVRWSNPVRVTRSPALDSPKKQEHQKDHEN